MACNLCGSDDKVFLFSAEDYISGDVYDLFECSVCHLVCIFPQPSSEQLEASYPPAYYGKNPFLYEKVDAFSRYKKICSYVQKGTRVLDVGCGRGLVLDKLKKRGCEVLGTELSSVSARYAREELGLQVEEKDLAECAYGGDAFDTVTMFHSLEHLPDPRSTLLEVNHILKPGGILIIEVPDFASFHARVFRKRWFHLDVPRHLYHFSASTLEKMLIQCNFNVVKKENHALMYDSFGLLQSFLNNLCQTQNLLNDLNTKRTNIKSIFKTGSKRLVFDAIISLVAQVFLYFPVLATTYLLSLFKFGGTLTFYSRKK